MDVISIFRIVCMLITIVIIGLIILYDRNFFTFWNKNEKFGTVTIDKQHQVFTLLKGTGVYWNPQRFQVDITDVVINENLFYRINRRGPERCIVWEFQKQGLEIKKYSYIYTGEQAKEILKNYDR